MKPIVVQCVFLVCVIMMIIGCGEGAGLGARGNSPPVIDHLIFPDVINPGEKVELQVVARDKDGDVLFYVWEVETGKLDSQTERTVKWTAPSDAKWVNVRVSVNDGVNAPTIKSRKIAVNLKNAAPVVTEIIVPESVHAGSSLQLKAMTDDADGDTLTYDWEVEAGELSSNTESSPAWTAPIDMGSTTITLRISDGINDPVAESISIRVIHSLIVAGERAAGIRLGDEFIRVKTLYGRPGEGPDHIGHFTYREIGLSGFIDGINLVKSLFIRKPNKARTVGGIGVGSKLERVEEEFGPAQELKDAGRSHWYWRKGIEFHYDARSRVESIYIFKPNQLAAPPNFEAAVRRKQLLLKNAALDSYHTTD